MSTIGTMFDYSKRLTTLHLASRKRGQRQLISAAVLVLADVLSLSAAFIIFRSTPNVPQLMFLADPAYSGRPVDLFVLLAAAFVVIRYTFGDYTRRRLFWDRARATTLTLIFLASPILAIVAVYPSRYSLFAELGTWAFVLFAIPITRHGARTALDSIGQWRLPTALIASEARVKDVFAMIDNTLTLASQINWLALEEDAALPKECGKKVQLLPFGDPNELAMTLYREGCSQAIVATSDTQSEHLANLVQRLMEVGISVSLVPSFRRLPLVGATTSYFFGKDILLIEMRSSMRGFPSRFVKRAFDIVGSLGLLALFSPFFLVIVAAIKLHDRGPIFYAQRRTGRSGIQFGCLKFRTMAPDADARLDRWKIDNPDLYQEFLKTYKLLDDPRVTAPGKWLRRSSLDELPQLFNVLLGEMSLVGPRPIPEAQLNAQYGAAKQLYTTVRPGLTGLWQISGRNNTSLDERVNFDEWYILNWTFWYDIVIIIQTAWIVVTGRGAY